MLLLLGATVDVVWTLDRTLILRLSLSFDFDDITVRFNEILSSANYFTHSEIGHQNSAFQLIPC